MFEVIFSSWHQKCVFLTLAVTWCKRTSHQTQTDSHACTNVTSNHINSFDNFPWGGIIELWHISMYPFGKCTDLCSCLIHLNSLRAQTWLQQTLTSITPGRVGSHSLAAVFFSLVLAECIHSVMPCLTLSYTHSHLADAQNNQSFTVGLFAALQAQFLGWSVMFRLSSTVAAGGSVSHSLSHTLLKLSNFSTRSKLQHEHYLTVGERSNCFANRIEIMIHKKI